MSEERKKYEYTEQSTELEMEWKEGQIEKWW